MMTSRSIAIIAGFLVCTGVSAVQATVVQWQLQNVRFDDGGIATGFVSVDIDRDGLGPTPGSSPQLVDWDIEVRGGNTVKFPPFEYTPASTLGADITVSSQGGVLMMDELFFSADQRRLYLVTHPVMTGRGGTVVLGAANTPSRESFGGTSLDDPPPFDRLVFGELTAVPEASRALFVAVGMVMLFCVWTRRGA